MAIQPILVTSIRGETDVLAYFSREDIFRRCLVNTLSEWQ